MTTENQELQYRNSDIPGVLLGVLVGGLAGAVTMLLLAPQSGKDTRVQIQKTGIRLRDRTTGMVQDTMGQMRSDGKKLVVGGRKKAEHVLKQGQVVAAHQLDRVSKAAQAGRKAIQRS